MYPSLKDGETIFCINSFFVSFKVGDIAVFDTKEEGTMVKRITKINEQGYYVKGTSAFSIDSSIFGYLQKEKLLYKMLFKLRI